MITSVHITHKHTVAKLPKLKHAGSCGALEENVKTPKSDNFPQIGLFKTEEKKKKSRIVCKIPSKQHSHTSRKSFHVIGNC